MQPFGLCGSRDKEGLYLADNFYPIVRIMEYLRFCPTFVDRLTIRHFRKFSSSKTAFDEELQGILKMEQDYFCDPVTQGHILFVASFLSLYRVMRLSDRSDEALKLELLSIVKSLGARFQAFAIKASLFFAKDNFEIVRKYAEQKSRFGYGPSFDIRVHDTKDGFVSAVYVCGYRNFLARHDALHLNPVVCEWDKVWIDSLPRDIQFRRPCTLAQGCVSCRFEFQKRSTVK